MICKSLQSVFIYILHCVMTIGIGVVLLLHYNSVYIQYCTFYTHLWERYSYQLLYDLKKNIRDQLIKGHR